MISISVSSKTDNLIQGLVVSERQRAYAVSNSINAVMKLIQKSQRERLKTSLGVRKNKFMERQIAVIKPFSTPVTQSARVSIGQKPRLRLSSFQTGGTQLPSNANNIAVPIVGGARPSQERNVPSGMFIGRMNLHKTGGSVQGKSSRGGVYLIRDVGIFVRTGSTTKPLYLFTKSESFPKRLQFYVICSTVTQANFARILKTEVTMAMNKTISSGVQTLITHAIAGGLAKQVFDALGDSEFEDDFEGEAVDL